MENKSRHSIYFAVGLYVFLYLAYICDQIYLDVPSYDINGSPYYEVIKWVYPAALLFIGTTALSLFWLMQNKLHPQKWVKIVYLLTGMLVTTAYNLTNVELVQQVLPKYIGNHTLPTIILLQNTFWPNTYLQIAGSLVGVIGFLLLVLPHN